MPMLKAKAVLYLPSRDDAAHVTVASEGSASGVPHAIGTNLH